jgi:hypothetical protein
MRRDVALAVSAMVVGLGLVGLACGAENAEAPRAEIRNADAAQCRSFELLMPNFLAVIDSGRTQNLACVVKTHLLAGRNPDDPPPINDVLRALFALLNGFAHKPAEPGAPAGQLCAPDEPSSAWPAVRQANELCELRRTMYTLVHQGRGIDAVNLVDPQVSGAINYIIGRGKDGTPHYEVAGTVSRMCSQNAQCQLSNGLDLLIALSAYLEDPAGKKTLEDLRTLLASPTIQGFLNNSDPNALTEDGLVAIAKVAIPAIQNANANDLQNLLEQPPLNMYKTELQPIVDDVKLILNRPELVTPMKKSLACLTWADANYDVVRMVYRLGIRDALPEFGVTRLTQLLDDLQTLDSRGALVHLLGTVSMAVRADDAAVDAAANVCRVLFSTQPTSGQAKSNAELALPVVGDLFAAGVASELLCALDTLVWGCAGGVQPACPANVRPPPTGAAPAEAMCSTAGSACCVHCGSMKPCGDTCISPTVQCTKPAGCACL